MANRLVAVQIFLSRHTGILRSIEASLQAVGFRLHKLPKRSKKIDAQDDCKKLERDMDEFRNNKDGKIEELKVRLIPSGRQAAELTFYFSRLA